MQPLSAVHRAAQKGDVEELRRLVKRVKHSTLCTLLKRMLKISHFLRPSMEANYGAELSSKDGEGRTALHHAVMRSHLPAVDVILELGGPKLLLAKDILGCTPVHLAAVQNQVTLILKLVAALLKDEGGKTPLHEIARRQCMQDFMGFLHIGWDLATTEDSDEKSLISSSPAWEAASKVMSLQRPGLAAVQKIMGWTPLHLAAAEGEVQLMESLIQEHGCNHLARSVNSWTPLHYAAAHNQVEAIRYLVKAGCPADVQDNVASTPLHIAAGEGHTEAIRVLVSLGCDPVVKDRDECTPLYSAAAWNRAEAVKCLSGMGCPSWVRSSDQRTAVHVAAEQGWADLIDLLVRNFKNEVDVRDKWQFTPLHSAANGGHVSTIWKLIQFSHEVDVKDYLGRCPLHYAAMHGRLGAVEALVKAGASVNRKDVQGGFTPMHLAADAGQCEAMEALLRAGASLNPRSTHGWTPLGLATLKGPANVEAICRLVELGAKVAAVTEQSMLESPLHIAARCGRQDIVKRLLACNLPILSRTKDGSTPLHYAAAFGQTCVIGTLMASGCPVDATDDAKNTPLHLAAGCGFIETVNVLVKSGADINARDITACTPLQNAAHGTYSALAAMPASQQPGSAAGTSGRSPAGSLLASPSITGAGRAPGPSKGALTSSQAAAQLALCNGSSNHVNGLVPVRTGLAWATLGGALSELSSSMAAEVSDPRAPDLRGLGIMQLLKQVSRRRGSSAVTAASTTVSHSTTTAGSSTAGLEVALARLAGSGSALQGDQCMDRTTAECTLEALLRRTEALQLSSIEADRTRLICVAERLVQLGAEVSAQDAEGRTALHLAAGCGDKAMVLKLVQLGTDINCRDSVGGTPMHHAAMANKKEMMFTLARLGCDWRARADGIDGATAAFVLCGQHGKTTRQQKLVEAKLKRVHAEGLAARGAGQDPLQSGAEDSAAADAPCNGSAALDEASTARADANMAALLAEVDLEGEGAKAKRKRRKKKAKAKAEGDTGSGSGESEDATEAGCDDAVSPAPAQSTASSVQQTDRAEDCALHAASIHGGSGAEAGADDKAMPGKGSSQASRAKGQHTALDAHRSEKDEDEDSAADTGAQHEAREKLEAAIAAALETLELSTAANGSQVAAAVDALDNGILCATEAGVSAKYAKKVLKRLQRQLDIILAPAKPSAEILHSMPAASLPEQQAKEQHPHPEQPRINGSRDPVGRPAAQPSSPAAENSILQHARTGIKAQAAMAPVAQPLASLPVRKAPPPGFVRVPKQSPQQPPQGKPAWTPVKALPAPAQPVVAPRSSAVPQTPMQPNGPAVWTAPPVQQGPRLGSNVTQGPAAMPASPRTAPLPPPPGFSSMLPAPDMRGRPPPPSFFAPPPPPPLPPAASANGPAAHPAPSPWSQSAPGGQQSQFSQHLDAGAMPGAYLQQPTLTPMAAPSRMHPAAALAPQGGMAAPAQQRAVLGQGPGTPRSWQGSQSPAGLQQSLFSRAVPEHLDAALRQSLDSQHRVSSLGGVSRDGSRRQSLENAAAGSMASHASTGCGSEPGSLANTPRTAPADTTSSLFAHAPYPASPSHALAAAAAQSAVSQPSAAYPGASRLSGRSGGLFMGAPPDALPADSMAMPDLASMQGLQHSGLSFGSGSLQLTPSHFGTNVSANTGQGSSWLPWS